MSRSIKLSSAILCASLLSSSALAGIVITPTPGYGIGFNGNDGDNFSAANPAPAPGAPANKARTAGVTPFGSTELNLGVHFISAINNGTYGNSSSWISADGDANPYVGLNLTPNGALAISSIAWGRDNGNNVTDACGGQCTDRWTGIYTLQRTTVAAPGTGTANTGVAATGWETMGTINYLANDPTDDGVVGGAFTGFFRHEYTVQYLGSPVPATGFRLLVPRPGLADGNAIDEIEIYGVPEPSTLVMCSVGLVGLLLVRRKRRA